MCNSARMQLFTLEPGCPTPVKSRRVCWAVCLLSVRWSRSSGGDHVQGSFVRRICRRASSCQRKFSRNPIPEKCNYFVFKKNCLLFLIKKIYISNYYHEFIPLGAQYDRVGAPRRWICILVNGGVFFHVVRLQSHAGVCQILNDLRFLHLRINNLLLSIIQKMLHSTFISWIEMTITKCFLWFTFGS